MADGGDFKLQLLPGIPRGKQLLIIVLDGVGLSSGGQACQLCCLLAACRLPTWLPRAPAAASCPPLLPNPKR